MLIQQKQLLFWRKKSISHLDDLAIQHLNTHPFKGLGSDIFYAHQGCIYLI